MVVFDKPGKANTKETVKLAVEAARKYGIKHIVVASYSGAVADEFVEYASEFNIVIVGQVNGHGNKTENPMEEKHLQALREKGLTVMFATHVLSGAERGLSTKFGGVYPVEIMAYTLRCFGQGVKVCFEIGTMALDGRYIPQGERIVAVAGSGGGADTALISVPAFAANIMETKIDEIICKPKVS